MRATITLRRALEDPALLGSILAGPSWRVWRILLIAAMGEALDDEERAIFRRLTQRATEPLERVDEFWCVAGRRGGKTRAAATLAVYLASLFDHSASLAIGERGLMLFLAQNQRQAGVAFRYAVGIFDAVQLLNGLVVNRTADTISLSNGIDLEVRAASFRGLRGATCVGVIGDEVAFWSTDAESMNADVEILTALRPSLATTGGPLVAISTGYSKRGEVYETHKRHYGPQGDPRILVAQGASRDLNPTLPQSVVDRAIERDAAAASAEWLGLFRNDLEAFVAREAVEACVSVGVLERAPAKGVAYVAFADPSGGSADSMTLAIAHRDGDGRAVVDAVRERRPPFSPDAVVAEFAELLKSYRIHKVTGDRYAGEWPRERFRVHGVKYECAEKPKSDLYRDVLALLNSGRVELLDHPRLIAQLCGLERRTARSGRDSIDHAPGARDDVANAVCGAAQLAVGGPPPLIITPEILAAVRAMPPRRPFYRERRRPPY
jgi:hypothetical protein